MAVSSAQFEQVRPLRPDENLQSAAEDSIRKITERDGAQQVQCKCKHVLIISPQLSNDNYSTTRGLKYKAITPGGRVFGSVQPPGSKSLTNRALIISALAEGCSHLIGPLESDDTAVLRHALSQLGATITDTEKGWMVEGGVSCLGTCITSKSRVLDVGASGTSARFLTALAALAPGVTTIDGTEQMRLRPMRGLIDALRVMGCKVVSVSEGGGLPVTIEGGHTLVGGVVPVDVRTSSQFCSALMMIAPFVGEEVILEFIDGQATSRPYLYSTAETMEQFGVKPTVRKTQISIPATCYKAGEIVIEADASAAVYPWAVAAITGGEVTVRGISHTSSQADMGVLSVLEKMGCSVQAGALEITVRGPERLRAVTVDMNHCPDAAVAIAVVALFAKGVTRIKNIANLRVKETDRLTALERELTKLGAQVTTTEDSISIAPGPLRGAAIDTYNDHRMAMAFSLAGLVVEGVTIANPDCVSKTWPRFFKVLDELCSNNVHGKVV